MIHDHLEFHNVEELQPDPGCHGWKLQRFPESVRNRLGAKGYTRGRFYAQWASGCKIRFVTPAKFFALTLSAQEADASGLTTDLLHPSDYGHIAIGEKLALLAAPRRRKITPRANP